MNTSRGRGTDTLGGRGSITFRGRGPGRGSGIGRGHVLDDGGCFFELQRLARIENYTEAQEDVMYRYGVPVQTTSQAHVGSDPHMDAYAIYEEYSQYPDIPGHVNTHASPAAFNSPRGDSRSNPSARSHSVPVVRGFFSSEANNTNEEVSQQDMPSPVIPPTVGREDRRVFITSIGKNQFDPAKIVREIAVRCIGVDFPIGWKGMKHLEQSTFEKWFERFAQIVKWDPKHELEISHNFRVKCGDIIKSGLYNVRNKRSLMGPAFVNPEILQSIEPIWDSDHSVHSVDRCGPHPMHVHGKILENVLGREPIYGEIYDRVKRRPDGT